jgi:hypothetical protein
MARFILNAEIREPHDELAMRRSIFIHRAQVHGGLLKLAANGSGIGLIDELEVGRRAPGL